MNERQRRFADYYLETLNAKESAIRAGYSKKTAGVIGDENLKKPKIRSYIDEVIANKQSERIAKQDEVLSYLSSVMRGEITESIPIGIGMGEQKLIDNVPQMKDRIKAAELLGKRYGLFTDKVDLTSTVSVTIVDDLKDDEDEKDD